MREHRRGPRPRPPWWPEDEPFPPTGPRPWSGMRRSFLRRVALVVGLIFVLTVTANILAVAVLSNVFGLDARRRLAPFGVVLAVSVVVGLVATGRAVRRM